VYGKDTHVGGPLGLSIAIQDWYFKMDEIYVEIYDCEFDRSN